MRHFTLYPPRTKIAGDPTRLEIIRLNLGVNPHGQGTASDDTHKQIKTIKRGKTETIHKQIKTAKDERQGRSVHHKQITQVTDDRQKHGQLTGILVKTPQCSSSSQVIQLVSQRQAIRVIRETVTR